MATLEDFLEKYNPEVAETGRAAIAYLTRLYPASQRLVYDNYNALAIGFGPSEKASQIIVSIALYPKWVSLFLMQGATLADPGKRLKGSGTRIRHVVLTEGVKTLKDPLVAALLKAAVAGSGLEKGPAGDTIVKSVSVKQRPRR